MNMKKKTIMSQSLLIAFFVLLCVVIIVPFVMLLSISLSSEADVAKYGYQLFPKAIDFSAYQFVFNNPTTVLRAYGVTGFFSIVAMVLSLALQAMCAYPLSRKNLRGRMGISFYLYFTMLFSGGMVPSFILITQYLHLNNTIWVYIIPGLINPWYIFMIRTFYQSLPGEIIESAYVDGANEYTIFFRIVVPLCKPVFATVALFTFLNKWNDWMTSVLYVDDPNLYSLQYLLQKILKDVELLANNQQNAQLTQQAVEVPSETVRMAMVVVVAGPALVVFPFFQKYFVKGLTVGSVKG